MNSAIIAGILWLILLIGFMVSIYWTLRAIYHLCKAARILVFSETNSQIEKKSYKEVSVNNKNKHLTDFEKNNNLNFSTLRKKLNKVHCKVGIKQLRALERKRIYFKEIVSENISKDELTYIRYIDQIEKLSLSIVNSLQQSCLVLKSIITIDYNKLRQFNQAIEKGNANEILVHKIQLNLWDSQKSKVKKILFKNENVLTEIDFLVSKLSTINMENINFNSTIDGLNKLNKQYKVTE